MTHTPLNVDLKKMDYETFKTFMRELVQMYSNVKDDAYLLFYHNLRDLAKEVSTLPRNPLIFYGAYEIANNQVVVAIFEMQFTDEVFETEDGKPYQMLSIISSFAEDKIYLRCPTKIREHLTPNLNTLLSANKLILLLWKKCYLTNNAKDFLKENRKASNGK